jgi:hypothetical protein
MAAPRRRRVPAWAMGAGIAVLFVGICGLARWQGYWHTTLPAELYFRLISHANEFNHPR